MTDTQEEKPRLKINVARLIAGTLAAVTAAALSSRLGVAGTLAGTGLVSLVSGAAATVYEHSVERGRAAMRKAVDGFHPPRPLADEPAEKTRSPRIPTGSARRWALAGAGAVATFAVAIGIVTGIEAANGQALSGNGHQTTLGAAFGGSHHATTKDHNRQPRTPTPTTRSTNSPSPHSTVPTSPSTSPSSSTTTPKSSAPSPTAPSSTTVPSTTAPTPSQTPTQAPTSP